tara:strand:- start:751 stop:1230 length:480 start_codon:yes stop_codon:yes gene_type:complete
MMPIARVVMIQFPARMMLAMLREAVSIRRAIVVTETPARSIVVIQTPAIVSIHCLIAQTMISAMAWKSAIPLRVNAELASPKYATTEIPVMGWKPAVRLPGNAFRGFRSFVMMAMAVMGWRAAIRVPGNAWMRRCRFALWRSRSVSSLRECLLEVPILF